MESNAVTKRAAPKAKPIKRKKTPPRKKAAAKPVPPVVKDLPPGTITKAKPKNNGKHPGGRPTGYIPAYCERAYEYCLLKNATDDELAKYFGVNKDTIAEWKNRHPEFSDSIQAGKEQADAKVAVGLFKRAAGQTVVRTHVRFYKGKIKLTKYDEEILADPRAAELWLRNRQGKNWSKPTGGDNPVTGFFGIHIHESLKPTK